MNQEVLQKMLDTTRDTIRDLKDKFPIYEVNTSEINSPERTAEIIADHALSLIESQLREEILSISLQEVAEVIKGREVLDSIEAKRLLDLFGVRGDYRPRSDVEHDDTRVQALPVVVVRNKSGQVLRLRRKEQRSTSSLHEKLVIWAGGHVRREDGMNGVAIIRGALRELAEELRLNVEASELRLLGAVHLTTSSSLKRHLAIVFEWKAETDDVAVVLSTSEFFERRGTSLSGRFVDIQEFQKEAREEWSIRVVDLLLGSSSGPQSALF